MSYIVLWVIEGAFRKWVPASDTLFYVLRDGGVSIAVAAFIIVNAHRRTSRVWSLAWAFLLLLIVLAAVSVITDRQTLTSSFLGIRAYIGPAMFIAFSASFVPQSAISRAAQWISLLMVLNALLTLAQVISPATAIINVEVGGESASFVNAGNVVRASGMFSSPAGLTAFSVLATAISLGAIADRQSRLSIHYATLVSVAIVVTLGGARGALLGVAIVLLAYVFMMYSGAGASALPKILAIGVTAGAVYVGAYLFYPSVLDSFSTRFEQAAASEDTLGRLIHSTFGFFVEPFPLLGSGPGAHSSGGAQLSGNAWVEIESMRWVAELGLFGYALASIRLIVAGCLIWFLLSKAALYPAIARLSMAALVPVLLFGSITQQPSTQGFFAICSSMILMWPEFSELDRSPRFQRSRTNA